MDFAIMRRIVTDAAEKENVKAAVYRLIDAFEEYCKEHPGTTMDEVEAVFLPTIKKLASEENG